MEISDVLAGFMENNLEPITSLEDIKKFEMFVFLEDTKYSSPRVYNTKDFTFLNDDPGFGSMYTLKHVDYYLISFLEDGTINFRKEKEDGLRVFEENIHKENLYGVKDSNFLNKFQYKIKIAPIKIFYQNPL